MGWINLGEQLPIKMNLSGDVIQIKDMEVPDGIPNDSGLNSEALKKYWQMAGITLKNFPNTPSQLFTARDCYFFAFDCEEGIKIEIHYQLVSFRFGPEPTKYRKAVALRVILLTPSNSGA